MAGQPLAQQTVHESAHIVTLAARRQQTHYALMRKIRPITRQYSESLADSDCPPRHRLRGWPRPCLVSRRIHISKNYSRVAAITAPSLLAFRDSPSERVPAGIRSPPRL